MGREKLKKRRRKVGTVSSGGRDTYKPQVYVLGRPLDTHLNDAQLDFISRCSHDHCDTVMDEAVWSELPEELLFRILARLPVFSLLSFKTVCKKWNATFSSSSFWEICSEAPTHRFPVLQPYIMEKLPIYNPLSRKWQMLPYGDRDLRGDHLGYPGFGGGYRILWAGGLICFYGCYSVRREMDGVISYTLDNHIWVWNPLTSRSLKLPSHPSLSSSLSTGDLPLVNIIAYKRPFRYKVFVMVGSCVDVFDSVSRTWSTARDDSNPGCVWGIWNKLTMDEEPYPDSFIELRLDVCP